MHDAAVHKQALLPGGITLNWAESGAGDALVLVHGGHGGLVHWMANMEELGADHRVLAPDLPGFGASSDPGHCFTPQEHAEVLAAWLAGLDVRRARVVGFSFGSLVAIALALARPDLVETLVLVNPPGVGPRSPEALALPERMSAMSKQQGRRAGIEGTLRELMLSRQELVTPGLVDCMTLAAQRTKHVTRSISRQSPTLEILAGLQVPCAVLIGEKDPFHSNDLQGRREGIDAVLGAGATRFVPGAAHWLQYDQPRCFAGELRSFFQSLQQAQETT
jgi:2-hydroxy-6-oxonona-2,4-dienedioate hydrolase